MLPVKPIESAGKIIFLAILVLVGIYYLLNPQPWTVIDGTNLLIHEAGHLVFSWGGEFIMFLGGTILQLIIPLIFTCYFLLRGAWFSSFFGIYWTGINLINVGVYIADASRMNLPLLHQGSQHDWNYLLTQTHILRADQFLGNLVRGLGSLSILIALLLMAHEIWIKLNSTT
jgi:hypothetical protein